MRPPFRIARLILIVTSLSTATAATADDSVVIEAPTAKPEPEPEPADNQMAQLPRTIETAERAPHGAFPPPPPLDQPRTIGATVSIGPGWLALRDKIGRDGQGATSMAARLSIVVAPEWCVFLGVDRSSTDRGGATFAQTAALLGAQRYIVGRLYLGGAVAAAMVRESGVPNGLTDGPGWGFSAIAGIEALKTRHAALTAELSLTMAKYEVETWEMGGLRLGVAFY